MTPASSVIAAFTPSGKLRAAINLGNPILAHRGEDGQARGVSVDLAGEFARLLGVELELVLVDAAGKSVDLVASEGADIGFFAIDPVRGANIAFSAAYALIEGCYLVQEASTIRANDGVDQAAHRVVVGKGSAYDLFLTRTLQHAQILRAPTSPGVVDTFLQLGAEVAAGVRQQLEADAQRCRGLRLLDGRFMVIQQAMGTSKSRGQEAAAFLARFVEQMKASGFVRTALARHHVEGATVAPEAG
jgi:polar amino acid transport system substrate-binding protein